MNAWWSAQSRGAKLMIVALAGMFVSQFMNYIAPHLESHPIMMMGVYSPTASGGTADVGDPVPGTSGWEAHSYTWLWLALIAVLIALRPGPFLRRWGFWLMCALFAFCLYPLDLSEPPGWGLAAGLAAFGLSIFAAIVHGRSARAPAHAAG